MEPLIFDQHFQPYSTGTHREQHASQRRRGGPREYAMSHREKKLTAEFLSLIKKSNSYAVPERDCIMVVRKFVHRFTARPTGGGRATCNVPPREKKWLLVAAVEKKNGCWWRPSRKKVATGGAAVSKKLNNVDDRRRVKTQANG